MTIEEVVGTLTEGQSALLLSYLIETVGEVEDLDELMELLWVQSGGKGSLFYTEGTEDW